MFGILQTEIGTRDKLKKMKTNNPRDTMQQYTVYKIAKAYDSHYFFFSFISNYSRPS